MARPGQLIVFGGLAVKGHLCGPLSLFVLVLCDDYQSRLRPTKIVHSSLVCWGKRRLLSITVFSVHSESLLSIGSVTEPISLRLYSPNNIQTCPFLSHSECNLKMNLPEKRKQLLTSVTRNALQWTRY